MTIKGKKSKFTSKQKIIFVSAALLTAISVGIATSFSWFGNSAVGTVTRVQTPASVEVRGKNVELIDFLNLGNINVDEQNEDGEYYFKDYYFTVVNADDTSYNNSYSLQLAHTTNINFVYDIYKTKGLYDNDTGEYLYYTDEEFEKITGDYLNKKENEFLAETDDEYKEMTYGDYSEVQKNAYPLYWQETGSHEYSSDDNVNGIYTHFYVLRVKWSKEDYAAKKIMNNKETDIVYIMVGTKGDSIEDQG